MTKREFNLLGVTLSELITLYDVLNGMTCELQSGRPNAEQLEAFIQSMRQSQNRLSQSLLPVSFIMKKKLNKKPQKTASKK